MLIFPRSYEKSSYVKCGNHGTSKIIGYALKWFRKYVREENRFVVLLKFDQTENRKNGISDEINFE